MSRKTGRRSVGGRGGAGGAPPAKVRPHPPASTLAAALAQAAALHRQGQLPRAEALYLAILQTDAHEFNALHMLGVLRHQQGRNAEAADLLRAALAEVPVSALAHNHLGNALRALGQETEAIAAYRRALDLEPRLAGAHNNLGATLSGLGRHEQAIASYRRAIAKQPDMAEAHNNLGKALSALTRHTEAVECCRRAIEIRPTYAEAYFELANALAALHRHEDAAAAFRRALEIRPDFVEAYQNLGNVLRALNRTGEAIASFRRALALRPESADLLYGLGLALSAAGQLTEAAARMRRAFEIAPGHPYALGQAAWIERRICDWSRFEETARTLTDHVRHGRSVVAPFTFLVFSDEPADQLQCARTWIRDMIPGCLQPATPRVEQGTAQRLRIAYLSADFHEHATAYLMAELFERHDRERFEVIALSYGPDDASAMRRRLERAFDRFVDARHLSDAEAARRLAELGAHIAVDLKGATGDARPGILARRPAPVQVSYLGYPGTMGADFLDYILVDRFVVPADRQPHYAERLVHLPDCYQVNDGKRAIAAETPSRAACGLPAQGFVFCSFNSAHKITPAVFDVWMRLLTAVPGSVLWLLHANEAAERNLRREAAARGVAAERLVFAPWAALPDHLARQRLADLFVDTLPYAAHTTASDALWVGLPVLTCAGATFAARVAGSLLLTLGLPELVTESLADYEAAALALATDPARLAAVRAKLADARTRSPLFDADRFRRAIEAAYTEMWARRQRGEPPRPFAVEPEAGPAEPGAAGG